MKCEIISIGNELLIGKIANTNAQWLTKRITALGGEVQRITTISDNIEEIASVIKTSVARGTNLIITSGGLGPTFDDRTLSGVSEAVGKPLQLNNKALEMVRKAYREAHEGGILKELELTSPRLKMAFLPKGSTPLLNTVGTAPGVLLNYRSVTIVSLPGVPSEMQAIFELNLVPIVRKIAGKRYPYEYSLQVRGIVESELAPLIDEVMSKNSGVYIKSHPRREEAISKIELHLYAVSSNKILSKNRVKKATREMSKLIVNNGGKLTSSGK
ncbi:MAG TPA: molybdopterin-binding protein [archaeon]|nr:molybdopterin-binding protein [archaeon]